MNDASLAGRDLLGGPPPTLLPEEPGAAREVSRATAARARTEPRFQSATAARAGRRVKGRKKGAVTGAYLNGMVPSETRYRSLPSRKRSAAVR